MRSFSNGADDRRAVLSRDVLIRAPAKRTHVQQRGAPRRAGPTTPSRQSHGATGSELRNLSLPEGSQGWPKAARGQASSGTTTGPLSQRNVAPTRCRSATTPGCRLRLATTSKTGRSNRQMSGPWFPLSPEETGQQSGPKQPHQPLSASPRPIGANTWAGH